MTAIAVFLLPATSPAMRTLKRITSPYVLMTSQWQKWDIFAPNPLRRVSVYRIEAGAEGVPRVLAVLNPTNFPWYEQVKDMKILYRFQEGWRALVPAYLRAWCKEHAVNAPFVRLRATHYVIPLRSEAIRKGWGERFQQHTEEVIGETSCAQL